jgi:hypothetical protein
VCPYYIRFELSAGSLEIISFLRNNHWFGNIRFTVLYVGGLFYLSIAVRKRRIMKIWGCLFV